MLADEAAVAVSDILAGASNGIIECAVSGELQGYAVYGASMRSAVEPLIDAFGIDLFDDGERLRSPSERMRRGA